MQNSKKNDSALTLIISNNTIINYIKIKKIIMISQ